MRFMLTFFAVGVLFPCPARPQPLDIGALAPTIVVSEWVTGELAGPQPFRDKTVILEFWATWCAPCIGAIPHLNVLAARFARKDVVFVAITTESRSVVETFLKRTPIRASVVLDATVDGVGKTHRAFGVQAIPATFLIDKHGRLRWCGHPTELTESMLETYLATGDVPPSRQSTLEPRPLTSIPENAFLVLVLNPATTISPDPKAYGRGIFLQRHVRDTTEIAYRGGSVADLITKLLQIPTSRLTIEGTPTIETFDLTLRATVPIPDSAVSAWVLHTLHNVFGATLHYLLERKEGWALTVVHRDRLRASAVASGLSVQQTDSLWIGVGVTMRVLARSLEEVFGEPFFDDTGEEGTFEIEVPTRTFATMRAALEQQYGMRLQETERPVSIARLSFVRRAR